MFPEVTKDLQTKSWTAEKFLILLTPDYQKNCPLKDIYTNQPKINS